MESTLFSGLDAGAFRNEHVAFLGDSTPRYTAQTLQALLHDHCDRAPRGHVPTLSKAAKTYRNAGKKQGKAVTRQLGTRPSEGSRAEKLSNSDPDLSLQAAGVDISIANEPSHNRHLQDGNAYLTMNLTEANARLFAKALDCWPPLPLWTQAPPNDVRPTADNRTLVTWAGVEGRRHKAEDTAEPLRSAWEATRRARPTVLVANMGLHWLHLAGSGPFRATS